MKKILFIKAQGLGDMISGIPKLAELKEKGYEVYQTFYDMNFIHLGLRNYDKEFKERYRKLPMYKGWEEILGIFKENGLITGIIKIPFSIFGLLKFLIKNFKRFDEVIIPIKTKPGIILGKLLGKKSYYIFEDTNDTSKYQSASEGEIGHKSKALYSYKNLIKRKTEKYDIPKKYITIFPSIRERSMEIEEWEKVINFLEKKDIKVVILGGEREKWFTKELEKAGIYPKISDVLGKTNLGQLIYILEHSILNISGNGGVMWLANLVNQKNINIHTVSAFLMEPPVDNINSHNIRPYRYPCCKPCEAAISTIDGEKIIPGCLFKNTTREGECRKAITGENIIKLIEKIGI